MCQGTTGMVAVELQTLGMMEAMLPQLTASGTTEGTSVVEVRVPSTAGSLRMAVEGMVPSRVAGSSIFDSV